MKKIILLSFIISLFTVNAFCAPKKTKKQKKPNAEQSIQYNTPSSGTTYLAMKEKIECYHNEAHHEFHLNFTLRNAVIKEGDIIEFKLEFIPSESTICTGQFFQDYDDNFQELIDWNQTESFEITKDEKIIKTFRFNIIKTPTSSKNIHFGLFFDDGGNNSFICKETCLEWENKRTGQTGRNDFIVMQQYIDNYSNQPQFGTIITDNNLQVRNGETIKVKFRGKLNLNTELVGIQIHDRDNPNWTDFGNLWNLNLPLPKGNDFTKEFYIPIWQSSDGKAVQIGLVFKNNDSKDILYIDNFGLSWEKANVTVGNLSFREDENRNFYNVNAFINNIEPVKTKQPYRLTLEGTFSEDVILRNIYINQVLNDKWDFFGMYYNGNGEKYYPVIKKDIPFKKTFKIYFQNDSAPDSQIVVNPELIALGNSENILIKDFKVTLEKAPVFEKDFTLEAEYSEQWGKNIEYTIDLTGISFSKGQKLIFTCEGISDKDFEFGYLLRDVVSWQKNYAEGSNPCNFINIIKDTPFKSTIVFNLTQDAAKDENVTVCLYFNTADSDNQITIKDFNASWEIIKK